MTTIEEQTTAPTPLGNALPIDPPGGSHHQFLEDITLGFALVWDRRVPARVKFVAVALAIGIVAVVVAVQIPIEALIVVIFGKAGFIGAMALDAGEALIGPLIFSCLLLAALSSAPLVDQIRRSRAC